MRHQTNPLLPEALRAMLGVRTKDSAKGGVLVRSPCRRVTENSAVYTLVEAHRFPIPKDRPHDRAAPGDNRGVPRLPMRESRCGTVSTAATRF